MNVQTYNLITIQCIKQKIFTLIQSLVVITHECLVTVEGNTSQFLFAISRFHIEVTINSIIVRFREI